MRIVTVGYLLAVFIVLSSCGQDLVLGDLLGRPAEPEEIAGYSPKPDDLMGAPAYSTYLMPPQPFPAPADDSYEYFFNYRLTNFAPDTEPFIKEAFGSTLGIKKASLWEYQSYTSLTVGFAANLPSVSVIEYGETAAYGSHTDVSESYFYNHLHYLKNLKEGTTYHYRVLVKDDSGQTIALPDRTLSTKTFTTEVKLYQKDFTHYSESIGNSTGAVPEPGPDVKTRPGLCVFSPGTYVLMEDISSDGLGINIKSHDVTIDLNGHTLTYDNGDNIFTAAEYDGQYNESGSWGIRAGLWNYENTKIYNGVIKQGLKGTTDRGPLFLYHMSGNTRNEIAGLTIDYYSGQTSGMYVGRGYTHHNVIYDRGGL
ncbi:MAG: hypothetical protein LBQ38_06340, partial [Spirochaetaceae bacterium]|nr:hypothetical protein [Spirochaetaceae bacterium]